MKEREKEMSEYQLLTIYQANTILVYCTDNDTLVGIQEWVKKAKPKCNSEFIRDSTHAIAISKIGRDGDAIDLVWSIMHLLGKNDWEPFAVDGYMAGPPTHVYKYYHFRKRTE